jgi:hypothetical protein
MVVDFENNNPGKICDKKFINDDEREPMYEVTYSTKTTRYYWNENRRRKVCYNIPRQRQKIMGSPSALPPRIGHPGFRQDSPDLYVCYLQSSFLNQMLKLYRQGSR